MTNQMLNIPTRRMLTAGILPKKQEFEGAWALQSAAGALQDGLLHFGSDKFVGTQALDCDQVWDELVLANARSESGETDPWGNPAEESGSWCSSVLAIFGFEWV